MKQSIVRPTLCLTLLVLCHHYECATLQTATEMACSALPTNINTIVDIHWIKSITVFYTAITNLAAMNRFAIDGWGSHIAATATPEQLFAQGCSWWTPSKASSFFGQNIQYDTRIGSNHIQWRVQGSGTMYRTFNYVKSDNASYILGTICYEDGQAAWQVISTEPVLDYTVLFDIIATVHSLGFNLNNIVFIPIDYCVPQLLRNPVFTQPTIQNTGPDVSSQGFPGDAGIVAFGYDSIDVDNTDQFDGSDSLK